MPVKLTNACDVTVLISRLLDQMQSNRIDFTYSNHLLHLTVTDNRVIKLYHCNRILLSVTLDGRTNRIVYNNNHELRLLFRSIANYFI